MRSARLLAVTIAACLVAGTVTARPLAAQDTAAPAKKPVKGRANLITEEEIASAGTGLQTAFQVVQRLRPQMLRVRSGSTSSGAGGGTDVSMTELTVYLDSQRLGGVDGLREIQTNTVREIRYLSPSDATTLFGTGHMAGAIQVVTKR